MKSVYSLVGTLCIMALSCTNQNNRSQDTFVTVDTLLFQEPIDSLCSNYIEDIEYVPLEQSEKHILPEATKIEEHGGKVFIFSKELHKIVVYSTDGSFLYELNRFGKGNEEYLEIANFTTSDENIYIVDNIRHQIVEYSSDNGMYKCKKDIHFVAWDMAYLSNNEFLFSFLPNNPEGRVDMQQPNGAVWKTDSTFSTILYTFLPYNDDYNEIIGKDSYFTRSNYGVIFHSFQNSGFFYFMPEQKSPSFVYVKMPQLISSNCYEELVEQEYSYIAETPYVTDDYIIFSVGKGSAEEPVLWTNKNRVFEKNREFSSNFILLFPSYVNDHGFVSYLSDYYLYQELVSDGFPKADEKTEIILNNGGACLVNYTMKKI